MKHVLEWQVIPRSEDQLRELLAASPFDASQIDFAYDSDGANHFITCTR